MKRKWNEETMLRPNRGGFLRPFGLGMFIRAYLSANDTYGACVDDPNRGVPVQDIFFEYKRALHRSWAEDAVERENKERIKRGLPIYTEEEFAERAEYYLARIPYKLAKCRYHSFQRYFHMLKQLEWVEFTGQEERSTPQRWMRDHPAASPRRFYRLTKAGIEAPDEDWSNPQCALYPEIGDMLIEDYLRERRKERKYRRPRRERFLRPITAGLFIRNYLLGLGPEGTPAIDPKEGDYPEHIFLHYKEMLRRAYARDAVALENRERERKGLDPYSPAEYSERLEWHRERITYKFHRARYQSFYRYFHWLKQLGWVVRTRRREPSYIQASYAEAPPCVYYRISAKGKRASEIDWFRPQITLYPEFTPQYFAQKNMERQGRPSGL
jgi:hypothetical protein